MPVRKIPKNYRNVTGVRSDPRSGERKQYESTLERDFLILLGFDARVSSYEVQPTQIVWKDAYGKTRRYTPDVFVEYENNELLPTLFEVKYRSDLFKNWHDLKPKFKAAIAFCKQHGWCFKLITEKEIRTEQLKSIKFLSHYMQPPHTPSFSVFKERVLRIISSNTPISISDCLQGISTDTWEQAEYTPVIWHLLATQYLQVDLTLPLSMSSVIWGVKNV